ncbi:hypothetical protein [Enemella dayhoffiae]|uniref:hypothetical protein n=1 Tax=Enemella dayhoffiae TaxID=2016507 RepID=UPI00113FC615|nr:hypothetical protein [Enemella dayhoffiae]
MGQVVLAPVPVARCVQLPIGELEIGVDLGAIIQGRVVGDRDNDPSDSRSGSQDRSPKLPPARRGLPGSGTVSVIPSAVVSRTPYSSRSSGGSGKLSSQPPGTVVYDRGSGTARWVSRATAAHTRSGSASVSRTLPPRAPGGASGSGFAGWGTG